MRRTCLKLGVDLQDWLRESFQCSLLAIVSLFGKPAEGGKSCQNSAARAPSAIISIAQQQAQVSDAGAKRPQSHSTSLSANFLKDLKDKDRSL